MYIDKLKSTQTYALTNDELTRLLENSVLINSQNVTVNGEEKLIVTLTRYNTTIGYDKIVEGLIKDRYSIEQEICLTNKGMKDMTNTEYVEYRNYVEQCKINARVFIEERYNAIGK